MSDDLLQQALEVEAFIASCQVDGAAGPRWSRRAGGSGSSRNNLYHGNAGVVLFYLELHRATDERRFLDIAIAGGRELVGAAALRVPRPRLRAAARAAAWQRRCPWLQF